MKVAFPLLQCWNKVPGGTATAAVSLVRAVAQRGNVELVGIRPHGADCPPELLDVDMSWADLPARFSVPLPLLYEAWTYTPLSGIESAVRAATGSVPDLVHTSMPIIPRAGSIVTTATLHDVFPLTHRDAFTPRGLRLMTQGIANIRRRAVSVAVSTEDTKRACLAEGFTQEQLHLIPLGVEVAAVSDADQTRVRDRYGLLKPFVLWVGTVEPRKNLPAVLSLAPLLQRLGADLVLVGPDGWSNAGDVVRDASTLSSSTKWLGRVPEADRDALYAAAAAFVFPSLAEGFGLPILEAMAQGTPVVTSQTSATAEAAGGAAALVDPLDHDALGTEVESILTDEDRRSRMIAASIERANACTWDVHADRIEAMWADAIANRSRRSGG